MPSTTLKSFAFYTVILCITIIGGALLWALWWQPSFAHGYIAVPYRQGHLFFPLWTFLPAMLSLALFLYCSVKTIKGGYQLKVFIAALLTGLAFLLFSFLLRGWLSSRGVSMGSSYDTSFWTPYHRFFTAARVLVILTIIVLIYQWRQAKGRNPQQHANDQDTTP